MPDSPTDAELRNHRRMMAVLTVSGILVGAAAAWYLLIQLVTVLRPLLVAIFLAYVLLPYHSRLRKLVGGPASVGLLAAITAAALLGLAAAISLSILELTEDLPELQSQFQELARAVEQSLSEHAPWLKGQHERTISQRLAGVATSFVPALLNTGRDGLLEACVVALYLLFLLLGASHFPTRVRKAYPPERAVAILQVAGQVNSAIIAYLKAKVKSSLLLAVPSGIVLLVLGVKFSLLWTVLIFLCNFVPYVGTVVGFILPTCFAFVQLGFVWQPIVAAVILLTIQLSSSMLVEPMILGGAVGLSPLMILAALAFWGLLWGLPGMVLAVPLTQVAVIVMRHFEGSRSIANLVAEN